ncbi:(2Fe-2S) ferredoxin domain-containing protein [Streptomyces sp. NPDC002640]
MSRRKTPARAAAPAAPRCTVTVCRGCCCGTPKIPGVDHAAQLAGLKAALGPVAQVRVVNCLDACEHANVVVVQPSSAGREAGGRPVWLGLVNDPDATADIAAWVTDGGPGIAEAPPVLELYAFAPSRRVRRAVED